MNIVSMVSVITVVFVALLSLATYVIDKDADRRDHVKDK